MKPPKTNPTFTPTPTPEPNPPNPEPVTADDKGNEEAAKGVSIINKNAK